MGKALKYIGITLLVLVFIGISTGIYINSSGIPHYSIQPVNISVKMDSASIVRGEKLAMMLCANCHLNNGTRKLSGTKMLDLPPELGVAFSRNITQDTVHGIGSWTNSEIAYLLRTGINKNGRYTPPYMVKLPNMADDDISAIIAFLRSDNPLVQPDPTPDIESQPSFLTKFLCRVSFKPLPLPAHKIELPAPNNKIVLGQYLTTNLGCYACHSADFKTNDDLRPENSKGFFAGGNSPLDKEGKIMLTPNITPDKETGIGNWTKDEFVNALRNGLVKNQPALRYPMEPYTRLTEDEAGAIYEYLQTIPAIKKKIVRSGI